MIRDFIGANVQTGVLFDGTYGIEIEAESLEPHKKAKFTFWDVKPDGSLRNYGMEYVLKAPLMYVDVPMALEEFASKMKSQEFLQDSVSTSIHAHVNILPETWKTVANFLTIYNLVENILIEYSGEYRRNNLFCLPIRSVPYVNKLCQQIFKNVEKKNYLFGNLLNSEQIKYAALNLGCIYRFGSIELRSHRGITDIELIYRWITIIQKMLEFSRQDITPAQLLDQYKDKGEAFLKEVFGETWRFLKFKQNEQFLKQNLWYAGQIAYCMTDDAWKSIDTKPERKDATISMRRLDSWSMKVFGHKYNSLPQHMRDAIVEKIMAEDAKKLSNLSTLANAAPTQSVQLVSFNLDDDDPLSDEED